MQTIKTNGREIVAVEVPEGASDFYISPKLSVLRYGKNINKPITLFINRKPVVLRPSENYAIIGLLSELPIVDVYDLFSLPYKSGKPALLQLNELYNLDTTKPLLIIQKLK